MIERVNHIEINLKENVIKFYRIVEKNKWLPENNDISWIEETFITSSYFDKLCKDPEFDYLVNNLLSLHEGLREHIEKSDFPKMKYNQADKYSVYFKNDCEGSELEEYLQINMNYTQTIIFPSR